MGFNSFDLAEQILASGLVCDEALAAWMAGIQEQGLRYCSLAEELIKDTCEDEAEECRPDPGDEVWAKAFGYPGGPGTSAVQRTDNRGPFDAAMAAWIAQYSSGPGNYVELWSSDGLVRYETVDASGEH